ncbi:MAG: hypothetical protein ACREQX_02960, partial [Candidatus Binataceae bacterium]
VGSSGNSLTFDLNGIDDYYNLGDVLHSINGGIPLNGLSQFTVEGFFNQTSASGGNVFFSAGSMKDNPGQSGTAGAAMLQITASSIACKLNIGGTEETASGNSTICANGTTCWVACSYDGATVRLYAGLPNTTATLIGSQAATGNLAQRYDETMDLGGEPTQGWPDEGVTGVVAPYVGKIFSFRISTTSRYGATAPTAPNAELTGDGNTMLLLNGDLGNPSAGLIGADYHAGGSANGGSAIYDLVVRGNSGVNQGASPSISHLQFYQGATGIFIIGEPGARISDVKLFAQSHAGILLYSNSYKDILNDINETDSGVVGIEGDIFSQYYVNNANIIGSVAGIVAPWHATYVNWSPSGTPGVGILMRNPDSADENTCVTCDLDTENGGSAVPFVVVGVGGGDTLVSPNMQTNSGANVEGMDIEGPVQVTITGGEYTGGTPAEIIKFENESANARAIWTNPQINGNLYSPSETIPISNAMSQMRVVSSDFERQPGVTVNNGVNFANFPASVINGASFYCPNCDPPANPPVACTSAGAKTGAWVHGINGAWVCAY